MSKYRDQLRDMTEAVIRDLQNDHEVFRPLRDAVKRAGSWRDRLRAIRALYEAHIDLGEDFEGFDPYSLELHNYWTPIEWRLWQDVRNLGRMQFVPQFPVGRYFLDFADPTMKVGIEADGKQFHDEASDRRRDQELWDRFGWKVYRVTGAETFRVRPAPSAWEREYIEAHDERPTIEQSTAAARAYYLTTSTGVAHALLNVEFARLDHVDWHDEMVEALEAHRLAVFPIGGYPR